MNSLINQEAVIYSLELTYSTVCFDRAEGHVLEINKFYKRTFLGWNFQVEIQLPLHGMTLSIYFCSEKTTVWSTV